ncbi:hypothetical protein [Methanobrevibacter sp.]
MVKINFCPSCGCELSIGSLICPACSLDIEGLFAKDYLFVSNKKENSIELDDGGLAEVVLDGDMPCDEKVIVVSQSSGGDEIVVDLDELGIDAENLARDVNIIVQLEEAPDSDDVKASEWHFEGDPYGVTYYEFPKE